MFSELKTKKFILIILVPLILVVAVWIQDDPSTSKGQQQAEQNVHQGGSDKENNTSLLAKIGSLFSGNNTDTEQTPDNIGEDQHQPYKVDPNPIIPSTPEYQPLSEEDKALYTEQKNNSEKNMKGIMREFAASLNDHKKRAELEAKMQVQTEEYKQAMLKLGKEILKNIDNQ